MSNFENPVMVSLEFTPNPNTLKYSVNRSLLEQGAVHFVKKTFDASHSPLASRLFGIPGIVGVMIGTHFVTVTKAEDGDWDEVHRLTTSVLEEHLAAGLPIVDLSRLQSGHQGGDTEIEAKIRLILDREIRPAVAMDGGDITFEKFEAGVVFVHLKGSCSGCPSSTMTLKSGIEARLKQEIPEVLEVVSI